MSTKKDHVQDEPPHERNDSVITKRQPVMFDTLADAFGTTLTSVDGLQPAYFKTDERPIARHNTGELLA